MAMIFKKDVLSRHGSKKQCNIIGQDVFEFLLCFMKKMNQRLCNTKRIFNIPVWYNYGIKIGGRHVFIETLYLNGITTIGDFLNEIELHCIERFYLSHMAPMQYNSIISAISK